MGHMSTDLASEEREYPLRLLARVFIIVAVCAGGFLLRCMHLFNSNHYYILSPDSYFFDWQAQRVLSHQGVPMTWHSGLTYPLAYAARATSAVLGIPQIEALRLMGVLLPPLLGAFSIVILYFFVAKMHSARIALLSAIVWAVAFPPLFITAAGYLDRDGLTSLLIMIAVFTFYVSRDWRWRISRFEVGWIAGCVAVVGVEALLYAEWMYLGLLVLLVILGGFWATGVMTTLGRSLYRLMMKSEADVVDIGIGWLRRVPSTLWRSEWRSLALILSLNAMLLAVASVAGIGPGPSEVCRLVASISRSSLQDANSVSELGGLTFGELLSYSLFGFAALGGLYMALKSTHRAGALWVGWFVCMFAGALFARRIFLFAAAPICVMAGMGLSSLLELRGLRLSRIALGQALSLMDAALLRRYAAAGLGVFIIVVCLFQSMAVAYVIGSNGFIAANKDWEAGMAWLRDNSPQDAAVMSHWNNGYFILDLSGRKPLVDNGDWDEERNHDISVVYCTTDISEAVGMMERHDANYVVFSKIEYVLLPLLSEDALGQPYGDGTSIPRELTGSLYARALSGEFVSEGGLRRIYPEDLDATDLPLVILELDTG